MLTIRLVTDRHVQHEYIEGEYPIPISRVQDINDNKGKQISITADHAKYHAQYVSVLTEILVCAKVVWTFIG